MTTYLRDFSDFQLIQLVMLPMFLFATTFYPLSVYPSWARPLIEILPLYQSIQLLREPALGIFHWDMLVAVALPDRVWLARACACHAAAQPAALAVDRRKPLARIVVELQRGSQTC